MQKLQNQKIGDYSSSQKVNNYYKIVKNNNQNEVDGVDDNIFVHLKQTLPQSLVNKNVIDLGCGDGRWSEYLASLNAKNVYGIDLSEDMIKRAIKRLVFIKNIRIIQADMQNLPLKDASIDIALSTFSMMYFTNLKNVIDEISRVLKNGGTLYITTNIINIDNPNLLKKLYSKSIPVDLGFDKKIHLENLVQPIEQYEEAFKSAHLTLKIKKYFEPIGVEISKSYKHKDALQLKKVLFVVQKNNK